MRHQYDTNDDTTLNNILAIACIHVHVRGFVSDIDDCVNIVCDNGGTCVDGVNSYTCSCVPGFTGISCQSGNQSEHKLSWCMYLYMCNANLRHISD